MGQDNTKLMQKQIFDLKFTGKSLARMSRKCEKRQKQQLEKVKKAIEPVMILQRTLYLIGRCAFHGHGLDFHPRVLLCRSMTGRAGGPVPRRAAPRP